MPNYFETANIPMLAAEFHYFRLAREKWEFMLSRLGQMGANTLTLSIPWGFHEVERGVTDLTGTTNNRRDVVGLLKLATALKFTCILEVGTYNRAGLLGNGLPLWLLERSADLEADLPVAVAGWYKALSQALTDQQWPAGPIIALSIESEPAEVESLTISKQLTEVKWPIWLRKHYEGIQVLNAAYGTSYRTISEVKFPENWAAATTPLEKDAQAFLETTRRDTQIDYRQSLVDSGWQLPIFFPNSDTSPPWQTFSLTISDGLAAYTSPLNLRQPIQIEPDPIDIGRGPVWAEGAPIRPDGSLREKFWRVRSALWPQLWPETRLHEQTLVIPFPGGSAVTRSSEAALRIDLPIRAKPALFRLRLSGELVNEDNLKVSRGKLSGLYQAKDGVDQTDLVFVFDNPLAPLSNFPLTYLSPLLAAQAHTLARCAALASALAQTLAPPPVEAKDSASERPTRASYIETAQRGLSEADAALRKALTSISELEGGMATILGRATPQPAHTPVAINRAIFEGRASDVLAEIGAACAKIEPTLQSAAASLQHTLEAPAEFTLDQYRQSYTAAITAARTGRQPLLEVIALLRLEIASERLPLVAWRIHNQVQEIAESLRWGVLRG